MDRVDAPSNVVAIRTAWSRTTSAPTSTSRTAPCSTSDFFGIHSISRVSRPLIFTDDPFALVGAEEIAGFFSDLSDPGDQEEIACRTAEAVLSIVKRSECDTSCPGGPNTPRRVNSVVT